MTIFMYHKVSFPGWMDCILFGTLYPKSCPKWEGVKVVSCSGTPRHLAAFRLPDNRSYLLRATPRLFISMKEPSCFCAWQLIICAKCPDLVCSFLSWITCRKVKTGKGQRLLLTGGSLPHPSHIDRLIERLIISHGGTERQQQNSTITWEVYVRTTRTLACFRGKTIGRFSQKKVQHVSNSWRDLVSFFSFLSLIRMFALKL